MKLREARAKGLIEAGDLAEKAKVSRANVYAIEAGRWLPNLATIRKISEALEIDPMQIDEFKAAIEATAQGTRRKKGPDLHKPGLALSTPSA